MKTDVSIQGSFTGSNSNVASAGFGGFQKPAAPGTAFHENLEFYIISPLFLFESLYFQHLEALELSVGLQSLEV